MTDEKIKSDVEKVFGDPIYSYSRAQAIEDGVLCDVTAEAKETGFTVSVVLTTELYEIVKPTKAQEKRGQSYRGRLHDVLFMLYMRIKMSKDPGTQMLYVVKMSGRNYRLLSISGPGDEGEHVITIGTEHDAGW